MGLTLADAARLSNDVVLEGVYETILNDDPLAEMIQFLGVNGNALSYNQEDAPASVAWYDPLDTWSEGAPTYTEKNVTLRIVGGDADVDQYMALSRSNVNNLEAVVLAGKAKTVWEEVRKQMIVGAHTNANKQPNGLDELIPASQQISAGTNGGTLTLAMMDELLDEVRGGGPDFFLMSRRSRRKLTQLMRESGGGVLPTMLSAFGKPVPTWNERPIYISDYILNGQTQGTATNTSRIYAVHTGDDGFSGLYGGGSILHVDNVGALETKDAHRNRVRGYLNFALFTEKSCAKLVGVQD